MAAAMVMVAWVGCAAEDPAAEDPLQAQGCDLDRAPVAYRATGDGAVAVGDATDEANAVYPCMAYTGHGANEPGLGIAGDGTVYFAPATTSEGNGILRSTDRGASWELSIPEFPGGGGHPKLQPFFHLDPTTDRLFFATSKLVLDGLDNWSDNPGIHLSISADGGETWDYHAMSPEGRDWQKIFTGPPVTSTLGDYPSVVYFTVPSPIAGNWSGLFPPPDYQHFYRSLDGGGSWEEVSQLPIDPAVLPGCEVGDYAMFGQGAVSGDGTVFLGHRRCRQLAVTVSEDEGETWETRPIPGATLPPYDTSSLLGILSIVGGENAITGEPITVDAEGNVYAVWADTDNDLYFASSQDQGRSWTEPVWVMAPGVQTARMVSIAARAPGTVAIAYFGSEDGQAFHGYIAESNDALADEPVFVSVAANDPADPLYPEGWQSGYDVSYFDNGGDEVTLIQVKYDRDGDVWAAFVKDMCPAGKLDACTWDYAAHASSRFQGAVGRLVHRE